MHDVQRMSILYKYEQILKWKIIRGLSCCRWVFKLMRQSWKLKVLRIEHYFSESEFSRCTYPVLIINFCIQHAVDGHYSRRPVWLDSFTRPYGLKIEVTMFMTRDVLQNQKEGKVTSIVGGCRRCARFWNKIYRLVNTDLWRDDERKPLAAIGVFYVSGVGQ